MDNENKSPAQKRAERQKYAKIQRFIRMAAILLAIVLSIIALANSCSTRKAIDDLAAQIREKKIAQAQEELRAIQEAQASASPAVSAAPISGGRSITLSFVGDCTLGMDEDDPYEGSFEAYYADYGASYFFQNVKSIFEGDDLTVANLEGTFTLSENRADQDRTFKADPSHVTILAEGGIDAVSVANDHTHDYGNESYVDTLANLDIAGIGRFGDENTLLLSVNGITVGLAGINACDSGTDCMAQALEQVQELEDQGAQIIIVEFHWGDEDSYTPGDVHTQLAHAVIDAGADLVIGHHSQVLQAVELYHGKYIAYSLGTFCAGGDSAPSDYDTMIFQQTFTVVDGVCQENPELNIIPCSISSQSGQNTYCPTPAEGDEAQRIMDKIYTLSDQVDGGIRQTETEDEAAPESSPEASSEETN